MSDAPHLRERQKEYPKPDEVRTLMWTKEMGERLRLVRMKMLKDQFELAEIFGVSQSTLSKLESGQVRFVEISIQELQRIFGDNYGFIEIGKNPERYNVRQISKNFRFYRHRENRKNVAKWRPSKDYKY